MTTTTTPRAPASTGPVPVTGATGYVGGRLVRRLLGAGYRVHCLARSAPKLAARPWTSDQRVEIVEADLGDADATAAALRGCQAAYYLAHSMVATGASYADADRQLAEAFAAAAARAGIGRIVYLGGLGEQGQGLSEHLASRREVEAVLAAGAVPVTVLRAAMIIGAGSASFEILHYLVERLPIMITPRWVKTASQPIAITNVLAYLVACLAVPATVGGTPDIGGANVVTRDGLVRRRADPGRSRLGGRHGGLGTQAPDATRGGRGDPSRGARASARQRGSLAARPGRPCRRRGAVCASRAGQALGPAAEQRRIKFLRTGFALGGVCGGTLCARSRSHGRSRRYLYGCTTFKRRGPTVCRNALALPMVAMDQALREAFEAELLNPARLRKPWPSWSAGQAARQR